MFFEAQDELDKHIVEEKGLQGKDLLGEKILALQVELGELANEWRGFKFWSEDKTPRKHVAILNKEGTGSTNPLLEEYVDCLHFILTIGIELKLKHTSPTSIGHFENTTETFVQMFRETSMLLTDIREEIEAVITETYTDLFGLFVGLGSQLGFTWEQIEQAYFDKNAVNHERQANGY